VVRKKQEEPPVPQQTVICKLAVDAETNAVLLETVDAFLRGAQIALDCADLLKTNSKFKVQKACYREIRDTCGLSANMTIRAIARACDARKVTRAKGRTVKGFHRKSIGYDARTFSLFDDETVSLTTLGKRVRIPLVLGDYQRRELAGKMPTAAVLKLRRGGWYIHFSVDINPPVKEVTGRIGVDRGIYNIAVTSTGNFFSGRQAMHRRDRFAARRRSLQSLGTKGANRALRRLGGKEHRWMRDVNNCISKAIVAEADRTHSTIVLEDLTGIRDRTYKMSPVWSKKVHAWAFAELDFMISYKAVAKGLPFEFVGPAYSSCTCPRCGAVDKRSRRGAHFKCRVCGYRLSADLAASRTVAGRHACPARAAVNQPMGSVAHKPSEPSPAL